MMFSANLNVSDHRVYFRLRPVMKRRNGTQQKGTCGTERDRNNIDNVQ
jgi:hypothetical protein